MVLLSDHPHIQALFWSTPDLREADEKTIFDVLNRQSRWIDWAALSADENALITRLAHTYGCGWIGDRRVQA